MVPSIMHHAFIQRLYNNNTSSSSVISVSSAGSVLTSSLPQGDTTDHIAQTMDEGLVSTLPTQEPSGLSPRDGPGYYQGVSTASRTFVSFETTHSDATTMTAAVDTVDINKHSDGATTVMGWEHGVESDQNKQDLLTTLLEGLTGERTNPAVEGGDSHTADAHSLWLISLVCFLAAICTAVVVIWFVRRRRPYSRLAVLKDQGYDYKYIYKPHGVLDDEYENTFVGVSVPLLQDITVI